MKLVFLGTTGYHPNNHRQTACLMIPETGVILDAGSGLFRARDHVQTSDLNIFLTHAHLDHTLGLSYVFDVIYDRDVERVLVHGEAEKLDAVQQHLFSPLLFPIKPPLIYRALPKGEFPLPQGGKLTHFPLEHPGGSIGFRLDWPNHSLAYVTDTCADEGSSYVKHLQGVDLLIHECYFPDGWEDKAQLTGHSCTSQVARVAKAAGAKRMMLVHINPLFESEDALNLAKAREIFPHIEVANDGDEVEF